ncbi:efflux RND transporter periplasmic adaptor subunit [Oceanicoccus sagamiensis]|uniref:Uncharacterized protein n=1 Tax=Oceanicoccus sagamiensis TaxID=716816 RepID=A0A1X9N9R9_9GAMM|nr:efflux RND transporter periplasmic adaptor subunit [Oceanicoccus sagamiensis]ARN72695.1 hypothetical protein BST96_00335 [Oceanicoccus sagamiensis]
MKPLLTTIISKRSGLIAPVLIIGSLFFTACSEPPKTKPLSVLPAMKISDVGELTTTPFPGRARAGKEVNLSFRVTGSLIDFPIAVGDQVEQGQLVAQLDPKDYISALGAVTGQLNRAQASAKRAEGDYVRINRVYAEDPGATSETALDLAKAARDSSRASVMSMTNAVTQAEDQLKYTSLLAPFSGVIVSTYVENFETVIAKQPILRLLDPSSIEFVISVPESLIVYSDYADSVEVTFDALPDLKVPATIKEVGREASQATRTYPVTLVMQQPKGAEILPGMAGTAVVSGRLPDSAQRSGIEIPATAIFAGEDTSKSYVWIIDPETKVLSKREVEVGQFGKTGVLIRSGISVGEWIAVRGVNSVREGQQVRIADYSGKGAAL